mmetsp:Transcript_9522/g.22539  ORF Transcript_9522/g.22539 Transcript_9522/m.22539 type:complete len:208 (-) Transcript_9522:261-884(-)
MSPRPLPCSITFAFHLLSLSTSPPLVLAQRAVSAFAALPRRLRRQTSAKSSGTTSCERSIACPMWKEDFVSATRSCALQILVPGDVASVTSMSWFTAASNSSQLLAPLTLTLWLTLSLLLKMSMLILGLHGGRHASSLCRSIGDWPVSLSSGSSASSAPSSSSPPSSLFSLFTGRPSSHALSALSLAARASRALVTAAAGCPASAWS